MREWIGPLLVGLIVLVWAGSLSLGRSGTADPIPVGDTVVDPGEVYDPVRAGEEMPPGFRQLLPRDAIRPVYSPEFVEAGQAEWPDDTLVIGVAKEGEAKAYPVSFLNRREMVIDSIARTPILVTW